MNQNSTNIEPKDGLLQQSHWVVALDENTGWPVIQIKDRAEPFIIFSDQSAIGPKGAARWANLILAWMNEQMRLGDTSNRPNFCDPLIINRLKEVEEEMVKLNLENQDLSSRFLKARNALDAASFEINNGIRASAKSKPAIIH